MARSPRQTGRIAKLSTPLGEDVLVLTRFDGHEGLGEQFEFRVEALSTKENIDFNSIIGQNCHIELQTYGEKKRFFNGSLADAQWIGRSETLYSYRLILRPWMWFLNKTSDCKIFQNKTVVDIIKDVFTKHGFSDYRLKLNGSYDTIEYCVQYRETDFDFISRLMEKYGIYYYFEHSAGKHELVLADGKASHSTITELPNMRWLPRGSSNQRKEQHVTDWSREKRFRTGMTTLNDYNYLTPHTNLNTNKKGTNRHTRNQLEIYDYPGGYDTRGKGEKLVKIQMEAEDSLNHRRISSGDAPSVFAGGLLDLGNHDTGSENKEYLVVKASHSFASETYRSGAGGGERAYMGHYEMQSSRVPFRSLAVTPRPIVHGPHTAFVVGASGEEIDVDKYGRIVVQFHWDRLGKKNENSSCRVRVSQFWAGKKWGGIFIPRIGMEVIVEFLEGDPDRPLVTGCVYNADFMPPYDLPSKKNENGWKSNSTKGGGGYNEYVMDDTKGSEKIRAHAQKDHEFTIENDDTWEIGRDQTEHIKHDQISKIDNDQKVTIKGKQNTDVTMSMEVTTGTNFDVSAGTTIKIKANASITLECGASKIQLTPAGITINAPMIKLN